LSVEKLEELLQLCGSDHLCSLKAMPWKGFKIWRGKLPHWRAEDVTYYVTFRHRRELSESERQLLMGKLMRGGAAHWDLLAAAVGCSVTELIFRITSEREGRPTELSTLIEPAKRKAGREIMKATQERWPPFFDESYDRILRDDAELEATLSQIIERQEAEDPERLYLADSS